MSFLTDPILMGGTLIFAVCTVLFIVLGIQILKKYQENKNNTSLIFGLNFIFTACALGLIAANRVLLNLLPDPLLGIIFHNGAIIFSLIIVVLLDIFAFLMTYPDYVKKLSILVSIIMGILLVILLLNQPTLNPIGMELVYAEPIIYIALGCLLPPILIPITVFFYFSVKVKDTSKAKSSRSMWMGIASIVIAISYLLELAGGIGFFTLIVRLGFLAYGIIMYICFMMPDWYKKRIGWVEE